MGRSRNRYPGFEEKLTSESLIAEGRILNGVVERQLIEAMEFLTGLETIKVIAGRSSIDRKLPAAPFRCRATFW